MKTATTPIRRSRAPPACDGPAADRERSAAGAENRRSCRTCSAARSSPTRQGCRRGRLGESIVAAGGRRRQALTRHQPGEGNGRTRDGALIAWPRVAHDYSREIRIDLELSRTAIALAYCHPMFLLAALRRLIQCSPPTAFVVRRVHSPVIDGPMDRCSSPINRLPGTRSADDAEKRSGAGNFCRRAAAPCGQIAVGCGKKSERPALGRRSFSA